VPLTPPFSLFLASWPLGLLPTARRPARTHVGRFVSFVFFAQGLGACVAYIRSVGVDMVDDLVYLKQSDVALMDLKQEYKDKLMDVLGRES